MGYQRVIAKHHCWEHHRAADPLRTMTAHESAWMRYWRARASFTDGDFAMGMRTRVGPVRVGTFAAGARCPRVYGTLSTTDEWRTYSHRLPFELQDRLRSNDVPKLP